MDCCAYSEKVSTLNLYIMINYILAVLNIVILKTHSYNLGRDEKYYDSYSKICLTAII